METSPKMDYEVKEQSKVQDSVYRILTFIKIWMLTPLVCMRVCIIV